MAAINAKNVSKKHTTTIIIQLNPRFGPESDCFLDVAVPHIDTRVRVAEGGQALGNHKAGSSFGERVHGLLYLDLRAGIHRGGGLIQDQHRCVLHHGAGNIGKGFTVNGYLSRTCWTNDVLHWYLLSCFLTQINVIHN